MYHTSLSINKIIIISSLVDLLLPPWPFSLLRACSRYSFHFCSLPSPFRRPMSFDADLKNRGTSGCLHFFKRWPRLKFPTRSNINPRRATDASSFAGWIMNSTRPQDPFYSSISFEESLKLRSCVLQPRLASVHLSLFNSCDFVPLCIPFRLADPLVNLFPRNRRAKSYLAFCSFVFGILQTLYARVGSYIPTFLQRKVNRRVTTSCILHYLITCKRL